MYNIKKYEACMEILLIHIIYYKINSLSQLHFDYAPQFKVLPLVMFLLFLKLNTLLILNY